MVAPEGEACPASIVDVQGEVEAPRVPGNGQGALLACLGAGFATLLDQSVVNYAVPSLAAELHASAGAVQWLLAVYSLTFGIGLVPGGRLGDAYGRRELFVVGLGMFFVGALSTVLATSVGWAVAGRCVQGFGAGIISAQVLGVIQDLFRDQRRVRALAAYGAAASASALVGPLFAAVVLGLAAQEVAWRLVLAVSLPFVLVTGVIALRTLPRRGPVVVRRPSLDVTGITLVAVLVVLVTVPVVDPSLGAVPIAVVAIASVAIIGALVWWERRARSPIFAPGLIRSGGFMRGNVMAALWFGASVAQSSVLTVFLLDAVQLAPLEVALVLVPAAAARMIGSWASARAHARFGLVLLRLCLAVQTLGRAGLAAAVLTVPDARVVAVVLVVELAVALASGMFEPAMRHSTLEYAQRGSFGLAASFLQLTQRLAATFCVALVTGFAFVGGTGVELSLSGSALALVVCGGLVAGAFVVTFLPPSSRRTQMRRHDRVE
ncbi:MFS transporter [Curtobacterium sp. SGAir0471]|uniref:MFS transporter n=1 Tax=Curtobacterium sp. SGAir0471 TaxID=2070337 RepID=UPI00158647FB|nr:MFS transporter [Curtobacterium sp. SGAir0471]